MGTCWGRSPCRQQASQLCNTLPHTDSTAHTRARVRPLHRVLINGWALNHTALSVHSIAGRSGDISAFANELLMKGFAMNEAGGIMKVTAAACLLMSLT